MTTLFSIIGVALGWIGGTAGGLWLGRRVRGQARKYWALNAACVVVCMAADFAGLMNGWMWLAYGSLGAMAGTITGLRYGYSEAARIWRMTGDPSDWPAPEAEDVAPPPDAAPAASAAPAPEAHDGPAAG